MQKHESRLTSDNNGSEQKVGLHPERKNSTGMDKDCPNTSDTNTFYSHGFLREALGASGKFVQSGARVSRD